MQIYWLISKFTYLLGLQIYFNIYMPIFIGYIEIP